MSVFSNPANAAREAGEQYTEAILKLLGDRDPLAVLSETPAALLALAKDLSHTVLSTPEAPGKWSMIEVIQHLADSDLVWAYRLRMVLSRDRSPLQGYDQDLWAERFDYRHCTLAQSLEQFRVLRDLNMRLLYALSEADMQRAGVHSERGEETVAHMIRLYAGHDLVHRRQLQRLRDMVTGRSTSV